MDQEEGLSPQYQERNNVRIRRQLHKMKDGGHLFITSYELMVKTAPNREPN